MRSSEDLIVNLSQAVFLNRGSKPILSRIQKKVCCRFETKTLGWNTFRISMVGTEVGVKKGRSMVEEILQIKFRPKRNSDEYANQRTFPQFDFLPTEIKQMIVDRVQCAEAGKDLADGRALLNLRLANKELHALASRTLERTRKCNKNKIYLSETYKSGFARLAMPPFLSNIIVPLSELDRILSMVTLDGCKEVHVRCEFRSEWCDAIMKLLIKHAHLKPFSVTLYGVVGKADLFHEFIQKRPSIQHLVFEKPLPDKSFFNKNFMPYISRHFYNLGPQDTLPENVRNAYSTHVHYSREFVPHVATGNVHCSNVLF